RRVSRERTRIARQQDDLTAHERQVRTEPNQYLGADALALTNQSEEDVLGPDEVVAEPERLAQRELQDLLRARSKRDVTRGSGSADADDLFDLLADGSQRDPERFERLRGKPFALADQAEQHVLGPDVVVIEE